MPEPTTAPVTAEGLRERLDEIEARENAATPGPWEAVELPPNEHYKRPAYWVEAEYHEASGTTSKTIAECMWSMADAEFIAHARSDVAFLRSELSRVLAALAGDTGDLPARMATALRTAFDYHIVAEWICCDPIKPGHDLCAKGQAAREMVASLLADDDPESPSPILAAVLSVRWENAAQLAAALGEALRREEYATSKHRVTQERLAEVRRERDGIAKHSGWIADKADTERRGRLEAEAERDAERRRANKAEAELTAAAECEAALRAELAEAKRIMAAKPQPSSIEELREHIAEILDTENETAFEAVLYFIGGEVGRVANGEMVARWQAEDALKAAEAERDALKAKVAEYENALTWQTSCLACAKVLDCSIAEHERAEKAEAAVERAREVLAAALAAWEPEHEYNLDRARRKGYSHNEVAAEVYGAAIQAVTETLAALDAPHTPADTPKEETHG